MLNSLCKKIRTNIGTEDLTIDRLPIECPLQTVTSTSFYLYSSKEIFLTQITVTYIVRLQHICLKVTFTTSFFRT